jgi:type I restriction enzyme S subunit
LSEHFETPLPQGWRWQRLKFIAGVQTGMAKSKDLAGAETVEVPYLRVANVQDGYLDLSDVATMAVPAQDLPRYRLKAGDVLMNEGGDFDKLGRGHIWHGQVDDCIHQNHVFAVRPHGVSSEWLNAYTGSAPAQFYFMGRAKQSTNLASISSSNLMELPVPLPPAPVQRRLLAVIDHETARIDALIEKKTRFIELLLEKRQAATRQAVASGLNPSSPLKVSGIEWIGQVPEHWRVCPLKWLVEIGNGSTPSRENQNYWEDGHYPWLTSSVVNSEDVRSAEELVTGAALRECHLPIVTPPAVLVGLTGQGRTRGMASTLHIEATISQHLAFLKPIDERLDVLYLRRYLDTAYPHLRAESEGAGSTKGAVSCELLADFPCLVPPLEEQRGIVSLIAAGDGRIAALVGRTESSVALLRERRAALITAAVTGQIDVCTEQPTSTLEPA